MARKEERFVKVYSENMGTEIIVLITGCIVAYVVSLLVIRGLMEYVRKHSFSVFGIYRIILGAVVLLYFLIF